ncbi:MAG TPA: ABC transporter permease [bacterium]|nr:ABC transporter permease [bacterium]
MAWYVVRRLIQMLPVLAGISFLVFGLLHLVPGDPAAVFLGQQATPEDITRLRHAMRLDRPIWDQFVQYVWRAARGDLGTSVFQGGQRVGVLIADHLPATVELAAAAAILAIAVGVPVGVVSAVRRGSLVDVASMAMAQLGVSMPVFWLGILLILLFSLELRWLPTFGRGEPIGAAVAALLRGEGRPLAGSLKHLAMPAVALSANAVVLIARMVRSTMLEALGQDYVRTARSKGLAERTVIYRHALRTALLPVITIVGLQVGALLGGAVVTETVFAWPGIGQLLVNAIGQRDFPVVQGTVLAVAVMFAFINLAVDVAYAWLDPRIRYG